MHAAAERLSLRQSSEIDGQGLGRSGQSSARLPCELEQPHRGSKTSPVELSVVPSSELDPVVLVLVESTLPVASDGVSEDVEEVTSVLLELSPSPSVSAMAGAHPHSATPTTDRNRTTGPC